jgi:hypothetical protein
MPETAEVAVCGDSRRSHDDRAGSGGSAAARCRAGYASMAKACEPGASLNPGSGAASRTPAHFLRSREPSATGSDAARRASRPELDDEHYREVVRARAPPSREDERRCAVLERERRNDVFLRRRGRLRATRPIQLPTLRLKSSSAPSRRPGEDLIVLLRARERWPGPPALRAVGEPVLGSSRARRRRLAIALPRV